LTPAANESSTNFASIDIGSHTIRLLIASLANSAQIIPVRVERAITRLARGFQSSQELSSSSMESSIHVLKTYRDLLSHHKVGYVACGATGVVRRADNSAEFLKKVRASVGLDISILSEDSEATLSAKGILSVLPDNRNLKLLFDLGGSSTEFLLVDPRQTGPIWSQSIFLGAATVTEKHLADDPPKTESVKLAVKFIGNQIEQTLSRVQHSLKQVGATLEDVLLVGTAGTATTLASMYLETNNYQAHRINGLVLGENWLSDITQQLAGLTIGERQRIRGLEKGREDIILGGALIILEILYAMKKQQLTVTDAGLLEGLLLDLIEKQRGMPHVLLNPLTWHWEER